MANPLSRASMQNQIKARIENEIQNNKSYHNTTYKVANSSRKDEKLTNLYSKEVEALKGIINRESIVMEVGSKPRAISLAEAAEKIKGR